MRTPEFFYHQNNPYQSPRLPPYEVLISKTGSTRPEHRHHPD